MAKALYVGPSSDPRYLLRKCLSLMSKSLNQLQKRAKRPERKGALGEIIVDAGLSPKDIDSLIGLGSALYRLSKQADADDLARKRQLKGMTDEQIEAAEAEARKVARSEAIKEGIANARLSKEMEDGED